jgi:hypothetical protein
MFGHRRISTIGAAVLAAAAATIAMAAAAPPASAAPHPSVTSISPQRGPISGGTQVTITGQNLTEVSYVLFGPDRARFTTHSSTSLTAVAPKHPAGVASIRVVTKHGSSALVASARYTWIAPTVTNVSPNAGPISGGTTVLISGTGLTDVKYVVFGSHRARSVTELTDQDLPSGSAITAIAPAHVAGRTNIRVITRHGATAVVGNLGRYTYVAAPRALRVSVAKTIDTNTLIGVSCPSASFCAAFDTAGNVVMDHSGTWGTPAPVTGETVGVKSLSCTSASFCMATDLGGHAFRWDGHSWTLSTTFDDAIQITAVVSCASPSFCEEVDDYGNAANYNGTSWTSYGVVQTGGFVHLVSVSCPTVGFCYAAGVDSTDYPLPPDGDPDSNSLVIPYRDGVWGNPAFIDEHVIYRSISCPQEHFCAVGTEVGVRYWTGMVNPASDSADHWGDSLWVRGGAQGVPASTVECANATFCLSYWTDSSTGLKYWARLDGASAAPQKFIVAHAGSFPTAASCWDRYACQFVGGTDTYRSS